MKKQFLRWSGILPFLIGLTAAATAWSADRTPEATVRQYVKAVYSRNYAKAYPLISHADKKQKTREDYLRLHVSFDGTARELAAQLASYIRYENARTEFHGDRATVVLDLILPNGNDPKLRKLLMDFDEGQLQSLPEAEQEKISEILATAHQRDELPGIVGEERFELVKETDGWKVFLNWAGTVVVRFTGEVKKGLPWDFEPVLGEVRAPPGEILLAAFRVRNRSDTPVSGKARHVVHPTEAHFEVIQCFCFIQQTLEPGEEMELPLLFRVNGDIPADVQTINVHYEFYPLEHFKQEWEKPIRQ
ncbi:MAG: cytochrome c oxidase assembly protein [Candidatus Methylomirabilales bacterium]